MTSQIIYNEANDFFHSRKGKIHIGDYEIQERYNKRIQLINKIDGINVKTYFRILKYFNDSTIIKKQQEQVGQPKQKITYHYIFDIIGPNIKRTDYLKHRFFSCKKICKKMSEKSIQSFFRSISKMLVNIRINKITGLIESDKIPIYKNKNYKKINSHIMIKPNKKYALIGECCICYDKTYTITSCSHHVCVECWSELKNNTCPYCRKPNMKFDIKNFAKCVNLNKNASNASNASDVLDVSNVKSCDKN